MCSEDVYRCINTGQSFWDLWFSWLSTSQNEVGQVILCNKPYHYIIWSLQLSYNLSTSVYGDNHELENKQGPFSIVSLYDLFWYWNCSFVVSFGLVFLLLPWAHWWMAVDPCTKNQTNRKKKAFGWVKQIPKVINISNMKNEEGKKRPALSSELDYKI